MEISAAGRGAGDSRQSSGSESRLGGQRKPGKVTAALDRIRGETIAYLNYLYERELAVKSGLPEPEVLEQPYYLSTLWRMRQFSLPYCAGGLEDQPHLVLMALEACVDAEQKQAAFQLAVEESKKKNQTPL